jgi:hypothetical protein
VGVAKLWARSKIAALESNLYSQMGAFGAARVEKEIETVALEHHLVSSQTSLVAIDKSKSRPDGQGVASVDMPVNLPEGWVYDKVFGPVGGKQHAMKPAGHYRTLAMDPSAAPMPSSPSPLAFDGTADLAESGMEAAPPADPAQVPDMATPVPAMPDPAQTGQDYPLLPLTVVPKPEAVPLPALKAPGDVNQQIALLVLLLAALSTLTFIFWRHHRRDYASPRRLGRRI